MKTQIQKITPSIASQILADRNRKNRKLVRAVSEQYAAEMKAGRWALTHQGIAFDDEGNLIDGQHRLYAVVLSGVSIDMMVTTDIPSIQSNNTGGKDYYTMDVLDGGSPRSVAQKLSMNHDIKNSTKVAAAARSIAQIYSKDPQSVKLSAPQVLEIIQASDSSFGAIIVESTRVAIRANSKVAAAVIIYHTVEPEKAIAFYKSYLHQTGWTDSCPVRSLERFRLSNLRDINLQTCKFQTATAAALMAFDAGEPLRIARVSSGAKLWLTGLNFKLAAAVKTIIGEK
jgi:hypothetical protein